MQKAKPSDFLHLYPDCGERVCVRKPRDCGFKDEITYKCCKADCGTCEIVRTLSDVDFLGNIN